MTITKQTTPKNNIAIHNAELHVLASNVIIHYLHIRPDPDTTNSNEDNLHIITYNKHLIKNIIVDHYNITWTKDEIFAIDGIGTRTRVQDVTVQNTIMGENIDTQYDLLLWNRATNITVYNNYFMHNKERNIHSSTYTSTFEIINNIVYNYVAATRPTYENVFDVIGNVFITNPAMTDHFQTVQLEASTNNCPDGMIERTRTHISDNILDDKMTTISNNLDPYLENTPTQNSKLITRPTNKVTK